MSTYNTRLSSKSQDENEETKVVKNKETLKRSADNSPEKCAKKRVLGDITNKANQKVTIKNNKNSQSDDVSLLKAIGQTKEEPKDETEKSIMYVTANEDINDQENNSKDEKVEISISNLSNSKDEKVEIRISDLSLKNNLPPGVEDFDKFSRNDPFSESLYAQDVFKYFREREKHFPIRKYLSRQNEITRGMRAILVDWMVEVQESFELNHETLYLAVKMVDRHLMTHFVPKAQLQLVGATATLIAAKYDERSPPLVDDFIYICDDSYTKEELIQTEAQMLQTMDFDLGIPLSYRFLRRYARCSRLSMELLTLARFILETSLMDYELIEILDSKIAAAALLLALKMKKLHWNPTLEYYSDYKEEELTDLVYALNKNISTQVRNLQTIRAKYSHSVFYEVAKIPPLKLSKPSEKNL